jgi:FixJ family two-component response regulator
MKACVVGFMTKPFGDQDLLDAVATAIERDRREGRTKKAWPSSRPSSRR